MITDYLVVGSGLTGATIARMLTDLGEKVLVVERRNHVGGNVHDHVHPCGIRIHSYGPHYFRTNSKRIKKFVNRFAYFYRYEAELKTYIDNRYENWPIAASYIKRNIGKNWKPSFLGVPSNFEEASLAMMPKSIYEKFVKGYTEKQWGVPPNQLSTELAGRFEVRGDDEPRLKTHKYQGIPEFGYSAFMNAMLSEIPVVLNFDYIRNRNIIKTKKMVVFTGPIDEFFEYDIGHLEYRGQKREHSYLKNVDFYQPVGQVNNPALDNGDYIRTLEWKHMMPKEYASQITGTVITRETTLTPKDPNHYEYPFPDDSNISLYKKYRERASKIDNLLICGRLGEYRYYDMDQAIARAMVLVDRILSN